MTRNRTTQPRRTLGGEPPTAKPAPPSQPDVEAQALMARARRVHQCETEVFAALEPILQRHRCRLATRQEILDGQPGPVRVVVVAND